MKRERRKSTGDETAISERGFRPRCKAAPRRRRSSFADQFVQFSLFEQNALFWGAPLMSCSPFCTLGHGLPGVISASVFTHSPGVGDLVFQNRKMGFQALWRRAGQRSAFTRSPARVPGFFIRAFAAAGCEPEEGPFSAATAHNATDISRDERWRLLLPPRAPSLHSRSVAQLLCGEAFNPAHATSQTRRRKINHTTGL